MLLAVQQNGLALGHAAEALADDEQVVLTAVTQNGLALQRHALQGGPCGADFHSISIRFPSIFNGFPLVFLCFPYRS